MLRRAISTLALTAVLAAPAAAQDEHFWFEGAGSSSGLNHPYMTWRGNFNSAGGPGWFQVFCVEKTAEVLHPVDNYDVWVTPFGGGDDFLHRPDFAWDGYIEAAQLASFGIGGGGLRVSSAVVDGPDYTDPETQRGLQTAIWYAMGFETPEGLANYTYWMAKVNDAENPVVINMEDWYVISSCKPASESCDYKQEMIAFLGDPPQETVPEPATMTLLATGLAGMAAARRRNKKS